MNEPMGLLGSFSPIRLRCMAFTILFTASSCPITFEIRTSFIWRNFKPSACAMRCTGMPDIMATTSATFSSSTGSGCNCASSSHRFTASSSWYCACFSLSRIGPANSYFCSLNTLSFSFFNSSIVFSKASISAGTLTEPMCTRDPASSRASMALSGKQRSVIYLSVRRTQASIASGV